MKDSISLISAEGGINPYTQWEAFLYGIDLFIGALDEELFLFERALVIKIRFSKKYSNLFK